jgi:hypothetical protein
MEDQNPPDTSKVIDITSRLRSKDVLKEGTLGNGESPKDFQDLLVAELSGRIKTPEESERLSVLLLMKVYERWPKNVTSEELLNCREILSDLKKTECKVYDSMLRLVNFMEATPMSSSDPLSLMGSLLGSLLKKETFYDPSQDKELIAYLLEPETRRIELILHGATLAVLTNYGK